MESIERIAIFLSMFEISNKKFDGIMEIVEEEKIRTLNDFSNSSVIMSILSTKEYHDIMEKCDDMFLSNFISNLERDNIKVLTRYGNNFPKALIGLPDSPIVLYAKGDLSLLDMDAISIVGTRSPSNYGKIITEQFAGVLANAGFVTVSGLAYGVDALSHKKTLEVGGKTIAVLGGGFNHIYPETHTNLANEIAEKGLLLSEYCPSVRPTKYTFPKRNRIIAGLSKGTLITEAGNKSGTIHTKEYALDYGRDLFAVPGNVNSPKSELPNMLIKSAQAECVLNGNDILDFYGMAKTMAKKAVQELNIEEQIILNLLKAGEQDFDYLAKNSEIPVNILSSYLTTMEIRGLIRRLPAKTYIII